VTIFVLVTSAFSRDRTPVDQDVWRLLLAVVTVAGVTLLVGRVVRGCVGDIGLVLAAGAMFGSVATLAKVLLLQPVLWSSPEATVALAPHVFIACCGSLLLACVFGTLLIQIAHRRLPSELVVAGLTVVDPLVAVLLGGAVLGEMQATPLWALIVATVVAAIAISGVFDLSAWHRRRSDVVGDGNVG
jgi:drug/metabolite transporter (DMT)-like permease